MATETRATTGKLGGLLAPRLANWILAHVPSLRETALGQTDGYHGLPAVSGNRHYMAGYRQGQQRKEAAPDG